MPSNIEQTFDHPELKIYTTTCSCMSHSISIVLEKESNEVSLNFGVDDVGNFLHEQEYNPWKLTFWKEKIIIIPIKKLKLCWNVIFNFGFSATQVFIFRDSAHIDEFLEVITSTREKMKNESK